MKIDIEKSVQTEIPAKDAEYGMAYRFMGAIIMCFEPCTIHEKSMENYKHFSKKQMDLTPQAKHFIRLSENDTMSLILDDEKIVCLGEPTISF